MSSVSIKKLFLALLMVLTLGVAPQRPPAVILGEECTSPGSSCAY